MIISYLNTYLVFFTQKMATIPEKSIEDIINIVNQGKYEISYHHQDNERVQFLGADISTEKYREDEREIGYIMKFYIFTNNSSRKIQFSSSLFLNEHKIIQFLKNPLLDQHVDHDYEMLFQNISMMFDILDFTDILIMLKETDSEKYETRILSNPDLFTPSSQYMIFEITDRSSLLKIKFMYHLADFGRFHKKEIDIVFYNETFRQLFFNKIGLSLSSEGMHRLILGDDPMSWNQRVSLITRLCIRLFE